MSTINELNVRPATIRVRRAAERGHAQYDWLDTWHTFSFDTYYDPAQMGFRALRVINEDRVQPGQGFGMHGHRDMEIITYVLEGALEHRDSLGPARACARRVPAHVGGDRHPAQRVQPLPRPNRSISTRFGSSRIEKGLPPSYEQKSFPKTRRRGRLRLVASPDAQDGSLLIHQDARVYLSTLDGDQEIRHELRPGRHAWLQVLRGSVELNGQLLYTSDGAAVSDETALSIRATEFSEVMLFDLL